MKHVEYVPLEVSRDVAIDIAAKYYELPVTPYIGDSIRGLSEGRKCSCAESLADRFGDERGEFGQLAKV